MIDDRLALLLGKVRDCCRIFQSGDQSSFEAWARLANLLLSHSVLRNSQTLLRCKTEPSKAASTRLLSGGHDPLGIPLQLTDGKWLRVSQTLVLDSDGDPPRLKVAKCQYAYLLNETESTSLEGATAPWVFRYDYVRVRDDEHPPGHLHVNAKFENIGALDLSKYTTLPRIHFPTGRMSLEAIIRLLVHQFGVTPVDEYWEEMVDESEKSFQSIAHQPASGRSSRIFSKE